MKSAIVNECIHMTASLAMYHVLRPPSRVFSLLNNEQYSEHSYNTTCCAHEWSNHCTHDLWLTSHIPARVPLS